MNYVDLRELNKIGERFKILREELPKKQKKLEDDFVMDWDNNKYEKTRSQAERTALNLCHKFTEELAKEISGD